MSAFDLALRLEMYAAKPAMWCFGPACAPKRLASSVFFNNLGGPTAALVEYLCTPPKIGQATYRIGPVAAIGGPAFGLRIRW